MGHETSSGFSLQAQLHVSLWRRLWITQPFSFSFSSFSPSFQQTLHHLTPQCASFLASRDPFLFYFKPGRPTITLHLAHAFQFFIENCFWNWNQVCGSGWKWSRGECRTLLLFYSLREWSQKGPSPSLANGGTWLLCFFWPSFWNRSSFSPPHRHILIPLSIFYHLFPFNPF